MKMAEFSAGRLAVYRARTTEIQQQARRLFDGGASGLQVATALSEATDVFLADVLREASSGLTRQQQSLVERHGAVIAVGGSGRGELAPFSDADLLFLYRQPAVEPFTECAERVVRDCWDAGIRLGHSLRTINDSINMGRQDPHAATALVEARLLWGSDDLFAEFKRDVFRKVIHGRRRAFINEAVAGRREEQTRYGATVNRLEPDVKRSLGGLRDVHLIRWIGFAHYGTADIHLLRLHDALSKEDARVLLEAQDFLLRLRIDLHFAAERAQDVLTREEQLRITKERRIEGAVGQLPVERFMQTYFRHSTAIANLAGRFVSLHQPRTVASRLIHFVMTRQADKIFRVGPERIDVVPQHRDFVMGSLEQVLKLYYLAASYEVSPAPALVERLKGSVPKLDGNLSEESAQLFLRILSRSGHLGAVLRSMFDVGLLELLVPDTSHARCLLQFDLYHSYTVDEHTLRAIEAAEEFEHDDGPLGAAHHEMHHREMLHLALLLHDLGKGFDADHSDVGRQIAERTADRLGLSEHQRDLLVFLVHKHLLMAHTAFRRDTTDPQLLLSFSHQVGSPETLRMLYVLTAADITAVGPDAWTGWKAELLTELYDRAMLILSGLHHKYHEHQRLERIKQQVQSSIVPLESEQDELQWRNELDAQLDSFPPHYLTDTAPARIAADLDLVGRLEPGDVITQSRYDRETGTFEYRFITRDELAEGCFHKIAGVLTAHRLEILNAHISTSSGGVVVDRFRVIDNDFAGEAPAARVDEIAEGIRQVLNGHTSVEEMFSRHQRFGAARHAEPVSNLPMRVVIDNDSSDRCTIIDVFAHDRTGLLYTISLAIHNMGLSVLQAKIATHFDQIVDVFYVRDSHGRKIKDNQRLREIEYELANEIDVFEERGFLSFVS